MPLTTWGICPTQLLDKHQIPLENLCAVSISTAGTVDYKTAG